MFKKALILIVLLGVVATTALADWPTPEGEVMPFYYINVTIKDTANLDSRKLIVFSKTFDLTKVMSYDVTVINGVGTVEFNAYDLSFYHKNDNYLETPDGRPTFFYAIARDATHTFGTLESVTLDWSQGYMNYNAELVPGGGPFPGKGYFAGLVTDKEGNPTKEATLYLNSIQPENLITTTVDNGQYTGQYKTTELDPAAYSLYCQKLNCNTERKTRSIVANEITRVDFQMQDVGIVPLIITRNGNTVEVTWEATYAGAQIFFMTGTGEGAYVNDYPGKWIKAETGEQNGYTLDTAGRKFKHSNQVGMGSGEAYYKGLRSSILPEQYESFLFNAPVVGKFNIKMYQGLQNMNSLPLILINKNIKDVIGNQLPSGSEFHCADQSGQWVDMNYGVSVADNWSDDYDLSQDFGFWLNVNGASPKPLTIIGMVATATTRDVNLAEGLHNFMGSSYPMTIDLNSSALGSALGSAGGEIHTASYNENMDWVWDEPGYTGGTWSAPLKFKPGRGFWIRKNSTGTSTWHYPKLY